MITNWTHDLPSLVKVVTVSIVEVVSITILYYVLKRINLNATVAGLLEYIEFVTYVFHVTY
jgi:hypothetical protein